MAPIKILNSPWTLVHITWSKLKANPTCRNASHLSCMLLCNKHYPKDEQKKKSWWFPLRMQWGPKLQKCALNPKPLFLILEENLTLCVCRSRDANWTKICILHLYSPQANCIGNSFHPPRFQDHEVFHETQLFEFWIEWNEKERRKSKFETT